MRPDDYEGALSSVEAVLYKRSLRHFVRGIWPDLQTGTDLSAGWYIDAICDHLEAVRDGSIRRLVINLLARSAKSTIASVLFPAWVWLSKPDRRFLTATYDQALTLRDSWAARQVIMSRLYQRVLNDPFVGERWRLVGDQNEKGFYVNDRGGQRTATQVGAGTGKGAHISVIDDPVSIDGARSDAVNAEAVQWLFTTLWTRQDDPKTSAIVIVQHRLRPDDPSGEALRRDLGFEHLNLPLEYDPAERKRATVIGWEDPRTVHGESLNDERWPQPVIDELKESLGQDYQAICNQRPTKGGASPIKEPWIKRWGTLPTKLELVQSWDTSFKGLDPTQLRKGVKRSRTAGMLWGFTETQAFLLDCVCEHMDFIEQGLAIKEMVRKWPKTTDIYVEEEANGAALITSLGLELRRLIGVNPTRKGSKYVRLTAVSPFFRAGNVLLPPDDFAPWVAGFVLRLTNYPTIDFDDEIDATSQVLSERWLPEDKEPKPIDPRARFQTL